MRVPLKGIRCERGTTGELTFSPALLFSLQASIAAFNQVPGPMFMQNVMFMQRLPTRTTAFMHAYTHAQTPTASSEGSMSEKYNADLIGLIITLQKYIVYGCLVDSNLVTLRAFI